MRFSFLNIPVYIHPTFWIFILLYSSYFHQISVIHAAIAGAVIFLSLLVHEFGHALTAKFFGARPSVTFEAFGGYASYQGEMMSPTQRFIITLNGPLFQSSLILISYLLLEQNIFQNEFVLFTLLLTQKLNIIWVLLNLLPVHPLDGGQMLGNLLERKYGMKGYRASIYLSILCVAVAAPFLYMKGYEFFSFLLAFLGIQNYQRLSIIPKTGGSFHPYKRLNRGLDALNNNDLKQAKTLLASLLKCSDKQIRNSAVEALAKALIKEKDHQTAYQLLLKTDPTGLKSGKILLCQLAYEKGNYELVTKYSRDIYEIEPTFSNALLNAKAFARVNNSKLAGGWLETAAGFTDVDKQKIKDLLLEKDFDEVRTQEVFQTYTKKILS